MSKSFVELANEIGELVTDKQKKYGNSFGKTEAFLKILFPEGIKPDQYCDLGLIFRMFDKLCRKATGAEDDDESPYKDLAGYALLGLKKDLDKKPDTRDPACNEMSKQLAKELEKVKDTPTDRPGGFINKPYPEGWPCGRDPDDVFYK